MILTALLVVSMFVGSISTICPRTSDDGLDNDQDLQQEDSVVEQKNVQQERKDYFAGQENGVECGQGLKRESEERSFSSDEQDGLEYAQMMKRESEDRSELVGGVETVQGPVLILGGTSDIREEDGLEYLQALKQDWDDRLDSELDRIARVSRYRKNLEKFQICLGSIIVLLAIYIFFILN